MCIFMYLANRQRINRESINILHQLRQCVLCLPFKKCPEVELNTHIVDSVRPQLAHCVGIVLMIYPCCGGLCYMALCVCVLLGAQWYNVDTKGKLVTQHHLQTSKRKHVAFILPLI